jgi:hypothetical protein
MPRVMPSQIHATLSKVEQNGRVFRLNTPILVNLFVEDALHYCEHPPLSIMSFGPSQSDAVHSFCEDFAMLWDAIAQSEDDSLTPDAKVVKQRLKAVVNSVVPIPAAY